MKKGVLIVFEGIDGSGKSTQAKILKRRLKKKGFDAVLFREPSKGRWGRKIREKALLPDSLTPEEELWLFLRDRKDNVSRVVKPALKQKKIVILDRYYFSTMAYQGARGIDVERIRRTNERFAPRPDLVFILDVDPKSGLERIEGRKKKYRLFEREDYLQKVRKIFLGLKGRKFIHLDGQKPIEETSREILRLTLRYLKKHSE